MSEAFFVHQLSAHIKYWVVFSLESFTSSVMNLLIFKSYTSQLDLVFCFCIRANHPPSHEFHALNITDELTSFAQVRDIRVRWACLVSKIHVFILQP